MQRVKLLKKLIADDGNGNQSFRQAGYVGYLDDNRVKFHIALGEIELVEDEPEPESEPVAEPDPPAEDEVDAGLA